MGRKYQPGGVGLIAVGRLTHRKIGQGINEKKLGRWQWMWFRGSHARIFQIVNIYRPCESTYIKSSYLQQARYLVQNNDICDPRVAFLQDFSDEINKWKELGDGIIIMGDWNTDVRVPTFQY